MSEQRAAALEFLTHRREGAQIAGGSLHPLRPELVLAQFGEAFRGCFFRNPAKEIEPLRPPMAGELGDLEFEIDRGRGVGAFAHSNQVAAGAEEGNAGLENRDILGMIVAEVAPQLVESFGHRRLELGEADARPRRHNPCERSVRRAFPQARRVVGHAEPASDEAR